MPSGDRSRAYNRIWGAVSAAVFDRFSSKDTLRAIPDSRRIDGKVCLITGANSGLGKAVSVELAKRGGRVLMACRSGHPDAGREVSRASGSERVEMLQVDLADLESVHALCDGLKHRNLTVDIAVLNAGLMPRTARRSRQGYELMFAVHFLANRLMIDRLLTDGVIRPAGGEIRTAGGGNSDPEEPPRIIVVASEAHRSSVPIDFEDFGAFTDYGLKEGLRYYAFSKLHLCTYAQELSRRLNPGAGIRVAVHSLCPGPVNSNIAREAPMLLKPVLYPIMRLLFASPQKAAAPVTYLCCADEMGERSGSYLHLMREKPPSALATDRAAGTKLWDASAMLLFRHAPGSRPGTPPTAPE